MLMKLHFICTGNVFRSRLAECYARYLLKNHPQFTVTSSGIDAAKAENGPISWVALRIIFNEKLLSYLSSTWSQTTPEILHQQDLIIFLQPYHFEQSRLRFDYHASNYETWDIADTTPQMSDDEKIVFSEKQFQEIKIKVNQLVNRLIQL